MPLSPSQRINLIKEISIRLGAEKWPLIDLTLREFSLRTEDEWQGDRDAYVMAMVNKAADQTLIDLAQHCGHEFESTERSPGLEPPFWKKGMFRMFVSHLGEHRREVATLQETFLNFGVSCFVAHTDIEPTVEWQTQIETALATCDSLLALLHPKFHESNWTDQEIGFAMGRGLPIFAVQLGQAPYGFIGRFQAFAGNAKSPFELAEEVFKVLLKHKQTERRMAEVVVSLFEQSNSFQQAKTRMGYVEGLQIWEQSFSARIVAAAASNSQISGSWGVPDRAKALAAQWGYKPPERSISADDDDEIPF